MFKIVFSLLFLLAFLTSPSKAQDDCSYCIQLINAIEAWVASGNTEEEIIYLVETVCTLVPTFETPCDAIVEQGAPLVIDWIQNNENGTVICKRLGLCNSTSESFISGKLPSSKSSLTSPSKPQDSSCPICTWLVSQVEFALANNASETEIISILDKLCSFVSSLENVCDSFVAQQVPQLISFIEENENPQIVCQQIGYCTQLNNKIGLK